MRIQPLAAEVRYALARHKDWVDEDTGEMDGEGNAIMKPKESGVQPDAPILVYKPLDPREKSKWIATLYGDETKVSANDERFIDLVEQRIVRIENLEVGEEPFNAKNPEHLRAIDATWYNEWGMAIMMNASLQVDDLGK